MLINVPLKQNHYYHKLQKTTLTSHTEHGKVLFLSFIMFL